jgi:hypothetical protein
MLVKLKLKNYGIEIVKIKKPPICWIVDDQSIEEIRILQISMKS